VLAEVLVGVSLFSLVVQVSGWRRLGSPPTDPQKKMVHRGLLRTARCRVAGATLYVLLGLAMLTWHRSFPAATLILFSGIQIMWQLNSFADVRLRRRLGEEGIDDFR
jgi:hypothetical protein